MKLGTNFELNISKMKNSHLSTDMIGAFAKLTKATVSFFVSVCPSAWNNSAATGLIFIKFCI